MEAKLRLPGGAGATRFGDCDRCSHSAQGTGSGVRMKDQGAQLQGRAGSRTRQGGQISALERSKAGKE